MNDYELTLYATIFRLPRDKCAECGLRRVVYKIVLIPTSITDANEAMRSVARCAKCLGIAK